MYAFYKKSIVDKLQKKIIILASYKFNRIAKDSVFKI